MSTKRKRKCLTVEEKVKILDEIKKGVSYTIIQERYGVGKSTITDMKSKECEIRQYGCRADNKGLSTSGKKVKMSDDSDKLDQAVYTWFRQQREKGLVVTGLMLQEKAKHFYKLIHSESEKEIEFSASSG